MNDNYLWDRTGKPDTEIQELEDLLGPLRYQPRRLKIPATVRKGSNLMFRVVAIAAGVAFLLIGSALLVRFVISSGAGPSLQVTTTPPSPPNQTKAQEDAVVVPAPPREVTVKRRDGTRNETVRARNVHRQVQVATPALTRQELAEKEQVLIALRLVSAKLNLVQRKSQGFPQTNAIRNQHKIG
ncbi:MAG: hypothetical protein ABR607_13170 [Pyrinomonadaceae bacterium]